MASDALTEATNRNISATTRDFWIKSWGTGVMLKMPLFAMLYDRKRIGWMGGDKITKPIQMAEMDELFQWYTEHEPLTSATKETATKPWFGRKFGTFPIKFTATEWAAQEGTGETKVIDFSKYLVETSQRGARIAMYKALYAAASTDAGAKFQSVVQALNHDATYGHTTRATTATNVFWQSASIAGTYADQDTAVAPAIKTVRDLHSAADMYASDKTDWFVLVGPSIYESLKSQVDASAVNVNPGTMCKYGFQAFTIDGLEIVKDNYLTAANLSAETTPQYWLFLININDWEMRMAPDRAFTLKPFVWQGDRDGGTDSWLSRLMVAGNHICWNPRGNGWLSNVSA